MKQGEFADQDIILLRRKYREGTGEYDLLTDEIPICGRRVRFGWFPLFGEAFRMLLPEDFEPMPEQAARVKYISTYRPPLILTGPNYEENFGFHLLEDEEASLEELIAKMENAVLRHAPETVVYDKGVIAAEGMEGRWFEYKNFTLDEETYNMQFLIRGGGHLLAGTFNCRMECYDQWKTPVLKALEKIEGGIPEDESR